MVLDGVTATVKVAAGRFDGFHAMPSAVPKTCLVRFDNNKYSAWASAVGWPVEIQAYADRVVVRQDGAVVAEHARRTAAGRTVYGPWHYVPILARKPGALRNGAPFNDWVLPGAIERVRRKLKGAEDGDRQMVAILSAVLTDGLAAVEAACAETIAEGVHSADVILNILARQRDPGPAVTILTPEALRACATSRQSIANATTRCRGPANGTDRHPRPDGYAEALRHAPGL